MDAEIEMDEIPFSIAEPPIEFFDARLRRTAVGGSAVDVGLAREGIPDREGVGPRDGVADEEDPRQGGIVLDEVPRVAFAIDLFLLMDGQVK
jgi:hypothetical protein